MDGELLYLCIKLDFNFRKPTHCALFFFFGFSLIPTAFAVEEKEIRSLIQKEMILTDDLSQKDCQKIVDGITKAANQPGFHNQHILDLCTGQKINFVL